MASKSDLLNKLKKSGTIKDSEILSSSSLLNNKDMITTSIPELNIALSGELDGGLTSGLTILAGPKATFKTNMSLQMVASYQKKYKDAICLFYDCEFGTTNEYLEEMGVDTERVLHIPISNLEEFKIDVMQKLKEISRDDKVIILLDSYGNLASIKEMDDAQIGKTAADMGTRAKALKALFRMIVPDLTRRDVPMVAIGHVYKEIGSMYPRTILAGGEGAYYAASTIILISKAQSKTGTELDGFVFTMNIEKSRYVWEKARIPLRVTFKGGIDPEHGLFEIAKALGYIEMPKSGWYVLKNTEKLHRRKDLGPIIEDLKQCDDFKLAVKELYKIGGRSTEHDKATIEKFGEITSEE